MSNVSEIAAVLSSNVEENKREAIEKYRNGAESDIFERRYHDGIAIGEITRQLIVHFTERLKDNKAYFGWLDEGRYENVCDALCLPAFVSYTACVSVSREDNPQNVSDVFEDEYRSSCDETMIRDGIVNALMKYCVAGAAVSKRMGAEYPRNLFRRAAREIVNCCDNGLSPGLGCMRRSKARIVLEWIYTATQNLWVEVKMEKQLTDWQSTTSSADPAQSEVAPAIPAIAPGTCQSNETVTLGPWARKFAMLDAATRTLTLRIRKNKKKTFTVPPGYKNAWMILKWLLESQDSEGWHTIDDAHADLREGWRAQFCHFKKPNDDMFDLVRYIHSIKTCGKRGATTLRLEQKERKIKKRK